MSTVPLTPSGIAAEARATLRLALPLMAGQMVQMACGTVEVVLAGHLSAEVLGAAAVGNSVWMVAIMALIGVMMAVSPSVAQLDGAGRRADAAPLFVQAAWIAVTLGLALAAAGYWGGPALAALMGVDPSIMPGVRGFLQAASLGTPAFALFLACRGLSEGISRPKATLAFALLGLAVLGPLGWALMFGRLGAPALGATGGGLAATAMCWVQGLGFALWIAFAPAYRGLGWERARLRPDLAAILALLRLGGPMAVSVLLEIGLFSGSALLIARFGPAAVSGHQIALNVAALCFMLPLGLGMAITVRVGNAVGRGDSHGVRRAVRTGFALVLATQAVTCTLLLALPYSIAGLYTSDPRVLGTAAGLLLLAAVFQFSDGIQVAANGALRGLKDTRVPMLITAISYWGAGMPIGLYFAFDAGLATQGMWIGLIAGLTCAAVLLGVRLHRRTALPVRR